MECAAVSPETELEPKKEDRLSEIFRLQLQLQKRMGRPDLNIDFTKDLPPVESCVVESEIKEQGLCLMMESAELIDWTRWKHWSKRLGNKEPLVPGSRAHIREIRVEIADLLHFLVNAANAVGMGADELYEEYTAKHRTNHARQNTGIY